jgi:hypothetical protein
VTPIDTLPRWAPRYAPIAIAAAFLSAVAGRFGLWTGQFRWDSFERFHRADRGAECVGAAIHDAAACLVGDDR